MSDQPPPRANEAAAPQLTTAQLTAHLEAVLTQDPHSAEALSVVDTILRSVPTPRSLAPLGATVSVERAALHARALLIEEHTEDAVLLLADIAALDPSFPAIAWLQTIGLNLVRLSAEGQARLFSSLAAVLDAGEDAYPHADSRLQTERLLAVLLNDVVDDRARGLRAEALRRAGLMHEAKALTEGATEPRARRTHLLATGAILLDEGAFVAASEAFSALGQDPTAALGREIAETMASPDDAFGEALDALRSRLAEAQRDGQAGATAFLTRLDQMPFFHVIPYPYDEATAQLRALLPTLPSDSPWVLRWEGQAPAPSVELAVALAAARVGTTATFDHGDVVGGDRSRRPLPPPPSSVELYETLIRLATEADDGNTLFVHAGSVAKQLTWDRAPEWAAVTAHLPVRAGEPRGRRGADDDVFVWVQRCQLAALSVLAQVDEGWDGSLRRVLLSGFLDARNPATPAAGDWTSGLAAVVAARVVRDDIAGSLEVATWIREREAVTPQGSWARFPLCCAGLSLRAGTTRDDRARWWREQSLWLRLSASVPVHAVEATPSAQAEPTPPLAERQAT